MGVVFLTVAAGLAVAGYLGYRKLQSIENEIREELEVERGESTPNVESEEKQETAEPSGSPSKPSLREDSGDQLELLILEKVSQAPGQLQTELYRAFADRDRKELQALLLQMDREGQLERKKKGSTYQLYPV